MPTDRELMQQVLYALEYIHTETTKAEDELIHGAIKALRARLAQPEQADCDGGVCGIGGYCDKCPKTQLEPEPVAWMRNDKGHIDFHKHPDYIPLYTSPLRRDWVGLTDEERVYLAWESNNGTHCVAMTEAKLKEKNG